MNDLITIDGVKSRLVALRGQEVLLARDVADLYGVETRVVNQAVRNNPDKFPKGYVFELDASELEILRSKILTFKDGGAEQQTLLQRIGEKLADIVSRNLKTDASETEIELNFAVVKIRHRFVHKNNKI